MSYKEFVEWEHEKWKTILKNSPIDYDKEVPIDYNITLDEHTNVEEFSERGTQLFTTILQSN